MSQLCEPAHQAMNADRGRQDAELVEYLARAVGWVLLIGGTVGVVAAFALVLDRIALLRDPAFIPSCSISPVLSCGSVMTSQQAEVLGFPNPLIGLVTFPIVSTIGVLVVAGGTAPRWVWWGLQAGTFGGLVFVHWLIVQSIYQLGALCPYCMAVWIATITVFWYTTLHNLTSGKLPVPARGRGAVQRVARYHGALVAGWLLLIAALIVIRFWPYWLELLP